MRVFAAHGHCKEIEEKGVTWRFVRQRGTLGALVVPKRY